MMLHTKKLGLAAFASALLASTSAHAAGFYIQESSVSQLGSAFAGAASSTKDASAVYFNPALLTGLDKRQLSIGANLLIPSADVDNNGSTFGGAPIGGGSSNPYDATPVPNFYFAAPITNDNALWGGIGVTAPFGLASDYSDNWFGRYDSTTTELTVINISPVLAYKINDMFSVGGGVDVQYAKADLRAIATQPAPVGTGEATLKGSDWSVGYNIGATVKPIQGTTVGAHYRSGIDQKLDGEIMFSNAIAQVITPGTAELNLPDIATLSVTQDIQSDWRAMAQVSWYGWNRFERIQAFSDTGVSLQNIYQGYQNTVAFSVGTEYDYNPDWTLRAGYQYDPTPTVDEGRTSRTPDGDRNWFTVGATYKYSEAISFDLAGAYIDVDDGTIDVTRNGGAAVVNADTSGSVGIVAAALNYKF